MIPAPGPIIDADDMERLGRQFRSSPDHPEQGVVAGPAFSTAGQSWRPGGRPVPIRDDERYTPAAMSAGPALQ
jgi:hypothetical protein